MFEITVFNFIYFSLIIFTISLLGIFLMKKNIILILLCVELMLLSINFNFVIFSIYLDDIYGQIFSLFILTVAAAESSIGLAILVVYYRIKGGISINFINSIKG